MDNAFYYFHFYTSIYFSLCTSVRSFVRPSLFLYVFLQRHVNASNPLQCSYTYVTTSGKYLYLYKHYDLYAESSETWSGNQTCIRRNIVWYKNNMQPLWTLVHTKRGPTPLNQPPIPSVLYIILSPFVTDSVSKVAAPGDGVWVEGDDVDIGRLICFGDVFDCTC